MPTTLVPPPAVTDRSTLLHSLARDYVLLGLGAKNFDVIPYAANVELRAPLCPGGVARPLVGRENLRNIWWPPLPQLIERVEVIDTFVNARQSAVTVEFHCHLRQPKCTLRIIDRFTVDAAGEIISRKTSSTRATPPTPAGKKVPARPRCITWRSRAPTSLAPSASTRPCSRGSGSRWPSRPTDLPAT
jgi:hypothetical protein